MTNERADLRDHPVPEVPVIPGQQIVDILERFGERLGLVGCARRLERIGLGCTKPAADQLTVLEPKSLTGLVDRMAQRSLDINLAELDDICSIEDLGAERMSGLVNVHSPDEA